MGFDQIAEDPFAGTAKGDRSRSAEQATERWRMEVGFNQLEVERLES
jgi:hypothetical protein